MAGIFTYVTRNWELLGNGLKDRKIFPRVRKWMRRLNFPAHTVILFSSRYLFPAKSICPTCEHAIQIFMQIRAAAPPNRKLRLIFV